jgi:hypothetical protein
MSGGQINSEQASENHGEIGSLILEAVRDVDQSLLDWMLSLSPRDRLRASSNAATALGKYRLVPPSQR